jgi:germination protein M
VEEEEMKKLLIPLALAIVVGACAKGITPGTRVPRADGAPSAGTPSSVSAAPATSAPATSAPAASAPAATGSTQVTVYYLVSFDGKLRLAPERHRVVETRAVAKAAMEELVHGRVQDPDHSSPYPRSAKINSVRIANAVATVDWSAEVLTAGVGAGAESLGIQAAVYTLTEFPSIAKVRFTVEGKERGTASNGRAIEDWWGHVGLAGQPWDRDPAIEVLEPVTLYTPLDGSASAGTIRVTGEASVFEATVGIILRDGSGRIVRQTSAMADEGAPGRGAFSTTVAFTPPASRQTWTLQAFEASAKDGSITFMEDRAIVVG